MTDAHDAKAREIVTEWFFMAGILSADDQKRLRDTIAAALRDCEREAFEAGQRDAIATLLNAPETTPEHVAQVFIDRERLHYRTEFDVGCVVRLAEGIRRARCDGAIKAERETIERAAQMAEQLADEYRSDPDADMGGMPVTEWEAKACENLAESIRALGTQDTTGGE